MSRHEVVHDSADVQAHCSWANQSHCDTGNTSSICVKRAHICLRQSPRSYRVWHSRNANFQRTVQSHWQLIYLRYCNITASTSTPHRSVLYSWTEAKCYKTKQRTGSDMVVTNLENYLPSSEFCSALRRLVLTI